MGVLVTLHDAIFDGMTTGGEAGKQWTCLNFRSAEFIERVSMLASADQLQKPNVKFFPKDNIPKLNVGSKYIVQASISTSKAGYLNFTIVEIKPGLPSV